MDEAEQFLPLYLRFVKGVVDSNDLPLNVSREILQQDDRVTTIRNALTKRVLNMLEGMAANEPEKYQSFWDEFGEVLKEGAGEDFANRENLCKLLRFASTAQGDGTKSVSLDAYLERKAEGQDKIYYLVADSYEAARNSPHLEIFKQRGVEVLLLFDRIDEWLMSALPQYGDVEFCDVTRGGLELPGDAGQPEEAEEPEPSDDLGERIKIVLGDRVESVNASKRLTESPACLVLDAHAMGPQMRRILAASGQGMPEDKPHFEYNASHPLVLKLAEEPDEDRFSDLVWILFDQASLAEGSVPKDAGAYVSRLNRLLLDLLNG